MEDSICSFFLGAQPVGRSSTYISPPQKLFQMTLAFFPERMIVLALFSCLAFPCWSQAEIEIFSESGDLFTMYLNQVKMNDRPAPRALAQIEPGYYQLRIDFEQAGRPPIIKNNFGAEAGMRSTGMITLNRKGEWVVRPFAFTPLSGAASAPTAPGASSSGSEFDHMEESFESSSAESFGISLNISAQETGSLSPTSAAAAQGNSQSESVQMNMSIGGGLIPGGVNMNMNVSASGAWSESSSGWETSSMNSTAAGTWSESTSGNTSSGSGSPMSSIDFTDYLNAIVAKTFEDSKLSTAQAPLKGGAYLSSAQIAQVMRAFTYESSRVEFAIFAHARCVDPQNYYTTHGAFEYELSIEELNEAIGQ